MYSLKCANCRLFVLTESCEGKYTLFVTMAIFVEIVNGCMSQQRLWYRTFQVVSKQTNSELQN